MAVTNDTLKFTLEVKASDAKKAVDGLTKSTRDLGKALKDTSSTVGGISANFSSLKGNLISLNQGWELASRVVNKLRETLVLTAGEYVKLQFQAAKISTLITDNEAATNNFSEAILRVKRQFGGTTENVGMAFYEAIASGATNASGSIMLVDQANRLAVGGATDLQTALHALTGIMMSYGYSAADTARINDILFIGAREGKTSIQELAQEMGPVLAIANQLNVSLGELVAAISTVSSSVGTTAEAVTSVRSALVALARQTDPLTALFKVLGKTIPVYNEGIQEAIKTRGFVQVLRDISNASGGSSESILKLMERMEALATFTTLTSKTTGARFDKIMKDMGDSALNAGAITDRAVSKMSDTLQVKFAIIKATGEEIFTRMGATILAAFSPLMEVIGTSLTGISTFFRSWASTVTNSVKEVWVAIGSLTAAILAFRASVVFAGTGLFGLQYALYSVATAAKAVAASFLVMGAAAAAFAKIGIIIIGLTTIFDTLIRNITEIPKAVAKMVLRVLYNLMALVEGATGIVQKLWGGDAAMGMGLWSVGISNIGDTIDYLNETVEKSTLEKVFESLTTSTEETSTQMDGLTESAKKFAEETKKFQDNLKTKTELNSMISKFNEIVNKAKQFNDSLEEWGKTESEIAQIRALRGMEILGVMRKQLEQQNQLTPEMRRQAELAYQQFTNYFAFHSLLEQISTEYKNIAEDAANIAEEARQAEKFGRSKDKLDLAQAQYAWALKENEAATERAKSSLEELKLLRSNEAALSARVSTETLINQLIKEREDLTLAQTEIALRKEDELFQKIIEDMVSITEQADELNTRLEEWGKTEEEITKLRLDDGQKNLRLLVEQLERQSRLTPEMREQAELADQQFSSYRAFHSLLGQISEDYASIAKEAANVAKEVRNAEKFGRNKDKLEIAQAQYEWALKENDLAMASARLALKENQNLGKSEGAANARAATETLINQLIKERGDIISAQDEVERRMQEERIKKIQEGAASIAQGLASGAKGFASAITSKFGWIGQIVGAAIQVLGQSREEFTKWLREFLKEAQDLPMKIAENIPVLIEELVKNLPTALEKAMPVLANLGTYFTGILNNALAAFIRSIPKVLKTIFSGPFLRNLANLFIDALIESFKNLWDAIRGAAGDAVTEGVGKALKSITGISGEMFAVEDIGAPFLMQADNLGKTIKDAGKTVVDWLKKAWEGLKEAGAWIDKMAFQPAINSMKTAWEDSLKKAEESYQYIIQELDTWGASIKETFSAATDHLSSATSEAGIYLQTALTDGANHLGDTFATNITFFKDAITSAWDNLGDNLATIKTSIVESITGAWRSILDEVKSVFNQISSSLMATWEYLKNVFGGIATSISTLFTSAWESLKKVFSGAWEVLKGIFTLDFEKIKAGFSKIFDGIGESLKGIFSSVWGGMKSAVESLGTWLSKLLSGAWDKISESASTFLKNIGTPIWNAIKNAAGDFGKFLQSAWDGLWKYIKNSWADVSKFFEKAWDGLWEYIKKGWGGLKSMFSDAGTAIWDAFKDAWYGAGDFLKELFSFDGGGTGSVEEFLGFDFPWVAFSKGGLVPGQSAIAGDAAKNDTVPALLSPGEIVLPRSVLGDEAFKRVVMAKLAGQEIPQFADGGWLGTAWEATKAVTKATVIDPTKATIDVVTGKKNPADAITESLAGVVSAVKIVAPEWANELYNSISRFISNVDLLSLIIDPTGTLERAIRGAVEVFQPYFREMMTQGFQGFANGGLVGTDTVPAMLTPGEFVLNRDAVQRLGVPAISALNAGARLGGGAPTSTNQEFNITLNIKTEQPIDERFIRDRLIPQIEQSLRRSSLDGKRILSPAGVR